MVRISTHICVTRLQWANSPPSCAAYMRQWTGSSLVQIMACRLFGAKPLPQPMLTYYQLDPHWQISKKFESTYKPTLSFLTFVHLKKKYCMPLCCKAHDWLFLIPNKKMSVFACERIKMLHLGRASLDRCREAINSLKSDDACLPHCIRWSLPQEMALRYSVPSD